MSGILPRTILTTLPPLPAFVSSTPQTRRMKPTHLQGLYRNICCRAFRPISKSPTRYIGAGSTFPQTSTIAELQSARSINRFSTTSQSKMSDEDYAAFLEKANQDPNEGRAKPASRSNEFKAQDEGTQVPKVIQEVLQQDKVYISDADEPFIGVALAWNEDGKGLPDEVEFAQLIQHPDPENAGVDLQDPVDWDSNGDYKDVIEAVRKAGKGNDVRVYSVPKGGVRTEYWLVTTEGKGKGAKLVGVKALSVES